MNKYTISTSSPQSSATVTPTNGSPASPNTHLQNHQQSKQIRPPKAPLYVPAALRPTLPARSFTGGPMDKRTLGSDTAGSGIGVRRRSTAHDSSVASAQNEVQTEPESEITQMAEEEWLRNQNLDPVTGPPSKEHWKADSQSPTCDSPICRTTFNLFARRHHCRYCGHVFCASHTERMVPLDQDARFHPAGAMSRACDLCWRAWVRWEGQRADGVRVLEGVIRRRLEREVEEREMEQQRREQGVPPMTAATNIFGHEENGAGKGTLTPDHPGDIVASSVPRDWSWSTF